MTRTVGKETRPTPRSVFPVSHQAIPLEIKNTLKKHGLHLLALFQVQSIGKSEKKGHHGHLRKRKKK
jgi:hypothetical protein